MNKVLVTGAAGFIGYHLCNRLINDGIEVLGLDNLNSYYDIELKKARLKKLFKQKMPFFEADISDKNKLKKIFLDFKPSKVINLAAQAGVRYSLENPSAYIQSNIIGFANILEECRNISVEHVP